MIVTAIYIKHISEFSKCHRDCHYHISYTKRIRKVITVSEYFRRSVEVVISRMRAVSPYSLASHRRQYAKSR
jgi:hypothetical protein